MPQDMNQLPIRHSASSAAASTLAGAAGGAIKGAAKGALYTFGLLVGLPIVGALAGGILAGAGVLGATTWLAGAGIGLALGFVPVAATLVAGGLAALGVWTAATPLAIGATVLGAFGLVKGLDKAHERVQQQSANANVLDAQLQAAAMDAQARMVQAQSYAPQPRVRHAVPEMMHAASPQIMASNDNEHHGTVAQAPERQVGHA